MLRKLFSYLYLIVLAIILMWALINHPPTLIMVLVLVCTIPIVLGFGFVFLWLQDAWKDFRYQRRLRRLLGDLTIEEVLEQSPYAYGYVFQGDDGYRVWRKDSIYDFVQSGVSQQAAKMWIVEQYFKNSPTSIDNLRF